MDATYARVVRALTIRYRLAGLGTRAARRRADREASAVSDPLQLLSKRARRRTSTERADPKRHHIIQKKIELMDYQDTDLICRDCGATFTFTAGQQAFFASRQLQQPRRCEMCRRWRRQQQVEAGASPEN
jgi:hypothetical protein